MGWERRHPNGPLYYYRKVRGDDGRVRSHYVGQGLMADTCAEMEAAARAFQVYRTASVRRSEATLDGAADTVGALTASVRVRLDAHMTAAGYRYHRGEWRLPRGTTPVVDSPLVGEAEPASRRAAPRTRTPTALPRSRDAARRPTYDLESHYPESPEPSPDDEIPRAVPYDGTNRRDLSLLLADAWAFRVSTTMAVMRGEGDRTHPVFQAYAAGATELAASWEDSPCPATLVPEPELSSLGKRERRGRLALGQAATRAPHSGRPAHAALAVAAVLDEVGVDGRAATAAAVYKVRRRHDWDAADTLGRAVVDQLALARACADLAVSMESGAAPVRARRRGRRQAPDHPWYLDLKRAFAQIAGADSASMEPLDQPQTPPSPTTDAVGERRLRRARRRLADAERLIRHARKAGLLRDGSAGPPPTRRTSSTPDDLLGALAAPPPVEPLSGEAALVARETAEYIERLRASWPPPARIRGSELLDPIKEGRPWLWDPFAYSPEDDLDDGEADPWWVYQGSHETPDEAEAFLATWAPEYVCGPSSSRAGPG